MTIPHMPDDISRQLEFAQKLVERNQQLQEQLAELTGTGEALDGWVRAGVDHAGRPCELTLEPRIMRKPSEDLAAAILEAFGNAYDDLTRQAGECATALRDELPEQLRDPMHSGVVDDLTEHTRDMAQTLRSSSDPGNDAMRLAEQLRSRVLRGI